MVSPKSVMKFVQILIDRKAHVIVVSAFGGMTNILQSVVDKRNDTEFFESFMPFHKNMAEGLLMPLRMEKFFILQVARFKKDFKKLLLTKKGSIEEEMVTAEIISMGEDFAQKILSEYINSKSLRFTAKALDSRSFFVTEEGVYMDAQFEQLQTKYNLQNLFSGLRSDKIYVIQGRVAGTKVGEGIRTTLVHKNGGDISAMLIATSLTKSTLTYVKTFRSVESKDSLMVSTGIRKLLNYMEETGRVIVNPQIFSIKNLPIHFEVIDLFRPTIMTLDVVVEPAMLEAMGLWEKVYVD